MHKRFVEEIKKKIITLHECDKNQLAVIFSESPRVIVEAPAGYGKTTTMISRIAYIFATGGIPNPKHILALTFSVNAALKIKRDVTEKLPVLLESKNNPVSLEKKVTVTNYHGFCKGVLKKYGYLLSDEFKKDLNLFKAIGDNEIDGLSILKTQFTQEEHQLILSVEQSIKESNMLNVETAQKYNQCIINKLVPESYITHNAIILLVLDMFKQFPEVKKFYQSYYPLIIVDEFQDTNCIAWKLVESLISDRSQMIFLGDPLQRIYGFIGALPSIMELAKEKYEMTPINLTQNYRFRHNQEMLKLDANIRKNALYGFTPSIEEDAELPVFFGDTYQSEAGQVAEYVSKIISRSEDKIAILFRSRGKGVDIFETFLEAKNVSYFYGMFTDEDETYVAFHRKCLDIFIKRFRHSKSITQKSLNSFCDDVTRGMDDAEDKISSSLVSLLYALVEKVAVDYSYLNFVDKYNLLVDIFENRQLKQAMEYVDTQVILSTVHGAKGLEWDYVILADVERWVFPGYHVCNECPNKYLAPKSNHCQLSLPLSEEFHNIMLDELSVFYVGITRAKKQVYLSTSANRINYKCQIKNSNISCLPNITGIKLMEKQICSLEK